MLLKRYQERIMLLFLMVCLVCSTFGSAAMSVYGAEANESANTNSSSAQFSDLKGHWAENTLKEWAAAGLIQGYTDGTLKPDRTVSRGEAMALINRSFGFKERASISFPDLPVSNWAYADVSKAVAAGYIQGYANGKIGTSDPISRQEAATIIARLLSLDDQSGTNNVSVFKDADQISKWSIGAVDAVVAAHLMEGAGNGTFKPKASITRAELIVVLDRAVKSRTSKDYNAAGTYGPEEGTQMVYGNVIVSVPGVTLKNMKITGDVLLAEGIKEGDVFLRNVTVLGTTTVRGGGVNSIHLIDCVLSELIVDKQNGTVRIVVEGSTAVATVVVKSAAILEESGATGSGFVKVLLDAAMQVGANVTFIGSFDHIDVSASAISIKFPSGMIKLMQTRSGADNSTLDISDPATIERLVLDGILKAIGQGTIESVQINEKGRGSTFEKQPLKVEGDGVPGGGSTVNPTPTNPVEPTDPTDPDADRIAIVKDGQNQAVIVLLEFEGDDETDRSMNLKSLTPAMAAEVLVEYVQKATGVELPIVTEEPADADIAKIYVGGSSAKDRARHQQLLQNLNVQGFIIDSQDGNISIIGKTIEGLEFGIYEFLERYVGVSWLMPGPDGEDVPQYTTLTIPKALVEDQPATISRDLYSGRLPEVKEWLRFNRADSLTVMMHHNLGELFDPEVFADKPQYYVDGVVPAAGTETWQPCFNNDTAQAAIARIIEYFNENPTHTSYSLAINDSGYSYCEAVTKTNSVGVTHMSDVYYPWVDKIAKGVLAVHEDKYFGVLAYREMYDPPMNEDGTQFKLDPHVVPFITDERLTWLDKDMGKAGKEHTEAWLQSATSLGFYEYLFGSPYHIPRVYAHQMAETYKYGQEHNVIARYAELGPNFGEGPRPWIATKLEWNPDQDVDALQQQWYERAVGADAAPYLANYYEHWEEFWTSRVFKTEWFLNWKNQSKRTNYMPLYDHGYLKAITKQEMAESRQLLEQAVEHAGTEPQRKRAELLLRAFEYYEASVLSFPKDRPATPATKQAALEMVEDVAVSYEMGQKLKQLTDEFAGHPVLNQNNSIYYGGKWDGIQRQLIYALQSYVASEPAGGPVREALKAVLEQIPEFKSISDRLAAYAVKTTAGKSAILNSLDFAEGPWTAAEPFSDFLIMDTEANPPVETKVYLLWDDDNLYVGYENFFDDVDDLVISDNADGGWWSSGYDDSNETYITTNAYSVFKGFFTNPNAVKLVYENSSSPPVNVTATTAWEAKASVKEDRWNLVQVIPFASIGIEDPKENRTLQGFFFRNYIGYTHWIGWGGGAPWTEQDFNPVHLVESKNLIGNPSFEEGTGDVPSPWSGYTLGGQEYFKRSDELAVTGNYSMMADGMWGGLNLNQWVTAEPGKYRMGFYYYMAGSATTAGEITGRTDILSASSQNLGYLRSDFIRLDPTKEIWNYYEFEYEIKADYGGVQPTKQLVQIEFFGMTPGERVYIDDVSMYKVE